MRMGLQLRTRECTTNLVSSESLSTAVFNSGLPVSASSVAQTFLSHLFCSSGVGYFTFPNLQVILGCCTCKMTTSKWRELCVNSVG